MGSRIHREMYVRFRGEAMETCLGDKARRCGLSLQVWRVEESLKVVHAYPRALSDSGRRIEAAERDLYTIHRNVAEDECQDHARNTEKPKRDVSLKGADGTAFFLCFCWFLFHFSLSSLLKVSCFP